jgi:hypothetical protein
MHTCSLDAVDRYPGVTEQAINAETQRAIGKLRAGMKASRLGSEDL